MAATLSVKAADDLRRSDVKVLSRSDQEVTLTLVLCEV